MRDRSRASLRARDAYGLDWREWGEFVLEMLEHQRHVQEHIASEVARMESATGEKVELPKLRKNRLGLLHLADPPDS